MKTLKKIFLATLALGMSLFVGISANAATTNYAAWAKCLLTNANNVCYSASLVTLPASDDGVLYLYALQPFEYSVSATDVLVGSVPLSAAPVINFSLTNAAGVNQICNKFALAVKVGGKNVIVATPQYITNPEVCANRTRARQATGYVLPYEKMVLYRIGENNIANINYGNYSTCVIVNKVTPNLIHPKSRGGSAQYYAFNAATLDGVATLQGTMNSLAANTRVDDFIIGNEVNTKTWNYMATNDWDYFVREYANAFRVSYNAIKSANANAKVYISLDQMWNRDRKGDNTFMDSADFMLKFNEIICSEGNIDWCLAFHPYLTPLTYAKFWDMSGCPNGSYYVNQITSNKMVSFQNLPVMTSMMTMPGLLNTKGQVRDIILPEIGITSAQGYDVQGAALVACYQACKHNPYVKQIYFHRMNEGGQLNFGTAGISEQVYQAVLSGNLGQWDAWAKGIIGIADWRQVVAY